MLTGDSVKLRALEPSDIDLLYEWENNQEVWNISDTVQPFSRFALEQYVNSVQDVYTQRQIRFIIETINTKTPIGCIDLFDFEPSHHRIGVGVLIASLSDRDKGYGKQALELILNYCQQILECHQVYCNVLSSNQKSLRLFSNLGFKQVGIKKDWIRTAGKFNDEILLQKLF